MAVADLRLAVEGEAVLAAGGEQPHRLAGQQRGGIDQVAQRQRPGAALEEHADLHLDRNVADAVDEAVVEGQAVAAGLRRELRTTGPGTGFHRLVVGIHGFLLSAARACDRTSVEKGRRVYVGLYIRCWRLIIKKK